MPIAKSLTYTHTVRIAVVVVIVVVADELTHNILKVKDEDDYPQCARCGKFKHQPTSPAAGGLFEKADAKISDFSHI